jgi:hypothetical protein
MAPDKIQHAFFKALLGGLFERVELRFAKNQHTRIVPFNMSSRIVRLNPHFPAKNPPRRRIR